MSMKNITFCTVLYCSIAYRFFVEKVVIVMRNYVVFLIVVWIVKISLVDEVLMMM